jgi:hypothetical protein
MKYLNLELPDFFLLVIDWSHVWGASTVPNYRIFRIYRNSLLPDFVSFNVEFSGV